MNLKEVLSYAYDIILPGYCLVCRRRLRSKLICHFCTPPRFLPQQIRRCSKCFSPALRLDEEGRCDNCRLIPLVFSRIRFLWNYEEIIRDIIHAMKYHPSRKLCRLTGRYLADALPELFPYGHWDYIIPVPSSKQSQQTRKFNQCQIIAKQLLKTIPQPVLFKPLTLKHIGYKHLQASLDKKLRIRNIRNVFQISEKSIKEKRILLVDDVITTGATSTAAAIALLNSGAENIDLIALARAHAWERYRYQIYTKMAKRSYKRGRPATSLQRQIC